MSLIRIASYNILSDALCDPRKFWKRSIEDCDPVQRFEKVKTQLVNETTSRSLFGLQEVSLNWRGQLETWFDNKNYRFICRNYSGKHSDYMGVALAIPRDKYDVEDVKFEVVSNYIDIPKDTTPSILDNISTLVVDTVSSPKYFLQYLGLMKKQREQESDFKNAKRRTNTCVAAKLSLKANPETKFWFLTYHMPCAFYAPAIMTLHVNGLKKMIESLKQAENIPVILTGDFNIKPDSPQYAFITKGTISEELPEAMDWTFDPSSLRMRSAYMEVDKTEPDFTNYAWMKFKEDSLPFIGTLDYIFLSEEFNVSKIKSLPSRTDPDIEKNGDMPNGLYPSDHLLISAEVSL